MSRLKASVQPQKRSPIKQPVTLDDALKQIPILWPDARLEQGATYIDLRDPRRREFTATGDMSAGEDNWYVPKDAVDYELWNRLIGITNPERLYTAPEPKQR